MNSKKTKELNTEEPDLSASEIVQEPEPAPAIEPVTNPSITFEYGVAFKGKTMTIVDSERAKVGAAYYPLSVIRLVNYVPEDGKVRMVIEISGQSSSGTADMANASAIATVLNQAEQQRQILQQQQKQQESVKKPCKTCG